MPRFAANLSMMFTEVPFPRRFEAAARAGFHAVEFLFPYDHAAWDIRSWLADAGLECVLFNLPPGDFAAGERGLTSLPGREAEFRTGLARALEYAEVLGAQRLHAMAGLLVEEPLRSEHRAVYIENLSWAAAECAAAGRTLLIEPINPRDMPGYFLTRQSEAHGIREEIGAPNLLVQMDFYHAQITGGDLATTFRTYIDAIGHVQIAGVPDRHEPDEGEVNYRYILALMDELEYEGWVGCEYRPRGATTDGLRWMDDMMPGPSLPRR